MFAPEIKVEKFEVIDVITTSVEENDCTYETACITD